MWEAVTILPGWLTSRVLTETGLGYRDAMIVLGLILLLVGILADIGILVTLGVILAVVGAVLVLLGTTGRAVGGRNHWF